MSFRNLSPTYQSALDAGQLPFHMMRIAVSGNGSGLASGFGYDDLSAGAPGTQYNYVEYIAGEVGSDIKCPYHPTAVTGSFPALRYNTSHQYHKRYFPNVKYWNSIENHSYDTAGNGIEVPVSANSLEGNDFCPNQPYAPDALILNYFELMEGDMIYGKFNKIAVYASTNTLSVHTIKINVGEYK